MSSPTKVAIVTGSNKGIGFAIVKALLTDPSYNGLVYLTARDVARGQEAVAELEKLGLKPKFHQLDITSIDSIKKLAEDIKKEHGGLDILVNNAAIAFNNNATEPFGQQAKETIGVNYFATLDVCHELFPLLKPGARVVNISSCEGHLSKINGESPANLELRKQFAAPDLTEAKLGELMNNFIKLANEGTHYSAGWPNSTYIVSKVGISALTRLHQRQLDETRPGQDISVNCAHPGYVDTDMTNHNGPLTIDQGAIAPTWLALLPPRDKLKGGYVWYDKQIIDWVDGKLPAPGY